MFHVARYHQKSDVWSLRQSVALRPSEGQGIETLNFQKLVISYSLQVKHLTHTSASTRTRFIITNHFRISVLHDHIWYYF